MSEVLSDVATEVYDRQIRLWGAQAQQRMMKSKVLIVGMSAINVEICKNLVLAGVSLDVLDNTETKDTDLAYNYFLTGDDVGENKAAACVDKIQALNSLVTVTAVGTDCSNIDSPALIEIIKKTQYVAICVAAEYHHIGSLVQLDKACRQFVVGFFVSLCCGTFGFLFSNIHAHVIEKLEAKQETEVPMSIKVEFPTLSEMLACGMDRLGKRTRPMFYSMLALYNWEVMNATQVCSEIGIDGIISTVDTEDKLSCLGDGFMSHALSLFRKYNVITDRNPYEESKYHLRELIRLYRRPFNLTASVLGALQAQEIRKYISKQHTPLSNCVTYCMAESVACAKSVGGK